MMQAARSDTCGARPLQSFVGRSADRATREALEQRALSTRPPRWVEPGDDILADLNTGRINIVLDASGTIMAISCY